MNLLKTPHQLLLEEAGATPASPGLLHTPKQMLMQEAGVTPKFAAGGKIAKGVLSLIEKEANKAKYLKDTKVVDYNGKPITMYHHTTDFKGDAFDPKLAQQKDQGYHGQGMYFGAEDYLKRSAFGKNSSGNVYGEEGFQEGSQVIPVHLSIKNPKYVDVTEQSLHGTPIEKLKEMGHDGVIVTRDDSFTNAMGRVVPRQKVYNAVAFEPTQVKSAIGNEGTYDPLDPRLHKAEGGRISVNDMIAEIIAANKTPQKFAAGSSVKNIASQSALELPFIPEEAKQIAANIKAQKYPEAAAQTAGVGYSAFAPINPLTALISGLTYSPELGDSTIEGFKKQEQERQLMEQYQAKLKADQAQKKADLFQKIKETRFYK
jgi:hypothetical protein